MRIASESFRIANLSSSREPRTVAKILNDHYTIYLTSHDDIVIADGTVFSGVIKEMNGVTQRVQPERGWSSIGAGNVAFLGRWFYRFT